MSYDRITSENAAVLFIDHQTGLANGVQTQHWAEFLNNVKAPVALANVHDSPAVVTTSAADGPNGPVMPAVTQGLRNATIVHRPGEINAWDDADFVAAVEKTGRKKLLVAGISTEVCLGFCQANAPSLRAWVLTSFSYGAGHAAPAVSPANLLAGSCHNRA